MEYFKGNSISNCKEGDLVYVGNWGKKPICWIVLAVGEYAALLVTEKVLFGYPYVKGGTTYPWEESDLNEYLNTGFMVKAFDQDERDHILNAAFRPEGKSEPATKLLDVTNGLFCLSEDEALELERILPAGLRAAPTEFYKEQVTNRLGMPCRQEFPDWWLRPKGAGWEEGPGWRRIPYVTEGGFEYTECAGEFIGVRPAMWYVIF